MRPFREDATLHCPSQNPTKHVIGIHQRAVRTMHVAEILQVPVGVLRILVITLHSMVISVQSQMKTDHYTSRFRSVLTVVRRVDQLSLVRTLPILRIHCVFPVFGRFRRLIRDGKQIIVHFESPDDHRFEL